MDYKEFGRVGVLMGGCSSEREISLKSGKAIVHALQEAGCDVSAVELNSFDDSVNQRILREARIDIGFIALHGVYGEDGQIQGLLEKMRIPYIGSGVEASRIAIDKIQTQTRLAKNGISIPEFCVVRRGDGLRLEQVYDMLDRGLVVVKPACEGSSIGIHIVQDRDQLEPAMTQAFEYGPQVLIERYISGRELTSGILGEEALPVVEIRPKTGFFDFQAKYQKGMTEYIVPAQIGPELSREVQGIALQVFKTIGCCDLARIDFIIDQEQRPFVLEVNTIPGFTATSLLPMAAQVIGCDFQNLCLRLLKLAAGRRLNTNVHIL